MRKLRIIITTILSLAVALILMGYSNIWLYINGGEPISSSDIEVKQLIIHAINIQYHGGDEKMLVKIFTTEYLRQISADDEFYDRGNFYLLDNDFMANYHEISQNESEISVGVQDLHEHYYQIITLTKDAEGKLLVSRIQNDI